VHSELLAKIEFDAEALRSAHKWEAIIGIFNQTLPPAVEAITQRRNLTLQITDSLRVGLVSSRRKARV
jgi:hypothetical protein